MASDVGEEGGKLLIMLGFLPGVEVVGWWPFGPTNGPHAEMAPALGWLR
jgi:hypothetical protein